ncbi:MAG: type 4a pilus biogenesis protein PilO [Chlorobia bacterium]|nr:type 4a pilus biogenesis protein PilO [Fimbriimonadaceae bacterium]
MAIGTFVIGLGASYFGYSQVTNVQGEVSALKTEVKDEKEVQAELDKAKATLDECAVKLQHLEQGVPQLAYVPTLMTELEKAGKQFGIKVLGVRPIAKQATPTKIEGELDAPKKKAYEEMTIEVKGIGSYGSVMRWVNALQQFPKIVAARSVTLSPKVEPGKTDLTLDVTVELRAYVFPQPQGSDIKTDLATKSASLEVKRNEG